MQWKLAASQMLSAVPLGAVGHGRDVITSHARNRDGHVDWRTGQECALFCGPTRDFHVISMPALECKQ